MVYKRKRRPRRRRVKRRRRFRISRAPLFGKTKRVRLRFAESGQFVPDPLNPNSYLVKTYYMNGVNSPSLNVIGSTPEGWANISPLFKKVYVLGSKLTANFLPANNAHSCIFYCDKSTVSLNGLLSPPLSQVLDNRYVSWNLYGSGRGNASKAIVRMKNSTKSWFTVKDVLDDDNLSSDTQISGPPSIPERTAYYNVGIAPTHGGSITLPPIDYLVVIDYICQFVEPVNIN